MIVNINAGDMLAMEDINDLVTVQATDTCERDDCVSCYNIKKPQVIKKIEVSGEKENQTKVTITLSLKCEWYDDEKCAAIYKGKIEKLV